MISEKNERLFGSSGSSNTKHKQQSLLEVQFKLFKNKRVLSFTQEKYKT